MLNEDTKIDLTGEIDSNQEEDSYKEGSKSVLGGMSLPVPINISQPFIKEWFGKRKANVRPVGIFFNTSNFQVTIFIILQPQLSIQPPGAPLRRQTVQETVQERGIFPVQLRDGLPGARPLLPHQLSPTADSDGCHRRGRIHCWPQECREETIYSWFVINTD